MAQLRQRLARKEFDGAEIDDAVERCVGYGYLDDHAYGLARSRAVLLRKPCGRRALLDDLRRQGLTSTMGERVAGDIYDEVGGEESVLADALRRWIAKHGEPSDWPAVRRCSQHLIRRGFVSSAVQLAMSPWLDRAANR